MEVPRTGGDRVAQDSLDEGPGEPPSSSLGAYRERHDVRLAGDQLQPDVAGEVIALLENQVQAEGAGNLLAPDLLAPRHREAPPVGLHHRRQVRKTHRAHKRVWP